MPMCLHRTEGTYGRYVWDGTLQGVVDQVSTEIYLPPEGVPHLYKRSKYNEIIQHSKTIFKMSWR